LERIIDRSFIKEASINLENINNIFKISNSFVKVMPLITLRGYKPPGHL
tara:strand:+ start:65 stop:211 length:147 start_codon:yes stop_codon:yes gene_type:complete